MIKLTASELRALASVEAGQVVRSYRSNGNVLHGPKGVAPRVLWQLHRKALMTDGPSVGDRPGVFAHRCVQVLTPKGVAALANSEKLR